MNDINRDYGYCTGLDCPLRDACKRYNLKALESDIPLWWTDGFYNIKKNKCEFIDTKDNGKQ